MRVIIVGCGRVGSALATQLFRKGNLVTVIDQEAAAFDSLPNDFRGRMIVGDVLNRNVLHRAEIGSADALAAVTTSDTLNALVAHLARSQYHVQHVVARNYDPRQQAVQEAFGVPVIGSASWRVNLIEDLLANGPLQTAYIDEKSNFAVYKVTVPPNWGGRPLLEFVPDEMGRVLGWSRAGQAQSISPEQRLAADDILHVSIAPSKVAVLQQQLRARPEAER